MALDLIRVLTGAEENWLKGTAGGSGICVLGALFNRVINTQHVSAAAQELLDCHPIVRTLIVENAKGKVCFQAPAMCSAAEYVEIRPWPSVDEACGDGAIMFDEDHHDKHGSLALHKLVTEELNVNFLNTEGKPSPPLRVFALLVYHNPSRQQTAILLKVHGAALDQKSVSIVLQEFLAGLDMAVEGRLHQSWSMKTEEGLPAPFEELIPKNKASKGFLQKGFDAVGYAINSKKYSLLPLQPSFSSSSEKGAFQTRFLSLSLGKQGTATFFDACKKENVSCVAALSASLLKTVSALEELKEKEQNEFCLTIIKDCRPLLEPKVAKTALGNYVSGFPEGVKVHHGVNVWDFARQILATIEKGLGKSKQFSEFAVLSMLYTQVMKYPSLTPKGSLRTGLLNMNVDPPMEGPCKKGMGQLGLVGTVGPLFSNHYVGPCFYILESLMEGPELVLTLVYASPLYSYAQMHHILHSSTQFLLEACHYTP